MQLYVFIFAQAHSFKPIVVFRALFSPLRHIQCNLSGFFFQRCLKEPTKLFDAEVLWLYFLVIYCSISTETVEPTPLCNPTISHCKLEGTFVARSLGALFVGSYYEKSAQVHSSQKIRKWLCFPDISSAESSWLEFLFFCLIHSVAAAHQSLFSLMFLGGACYPATSYPVWHNYHVKIFSDSTFWS